MRSIQLPVWYITRGKKIEYYLELAGGKTAGTSNRERRLAAALPADNLATGSGLLSLYFHFVDDLPYVRHAVGDLFDGRAAILRPGVTL